LDEGILTMGLGERSEFVIASEWAYGDKAWQSNAPPKIPVHLPLLFDVTLLKIGAMDSAEWTAIQEQKAKAANDKNAAAPASAPAAAPAPAPAAAPADAAAAASATPAAAPAAKK
jgi:hypothetical protein